MLSTYGYLETVDNPTFNCYHEGAYTGIGGNANLFAALAQRTVTVMSFIDMADPTSEAAWLDTLTEIYNYDGAVHPQLYVLAVLYNYNADVNYSPPGSDDYKTYLDAHDSNWGTSIQYAILRNDTWNDDNNFYAHHFQSGLNMGITSRVGKPFTYIICHNGSNYITDKLYESCGYNARRTAPADPPGLTDLVKLDWPAAAADKITFQKNYIIKRIKDALDTSPKVSVYPNTICTSEGGADPIAKIRQDSQLRFTFSEKAVGPGTLTKYRFSGDTGLLSGIAGDIDDTDASDGLLASQYLTTTPTEMKESWVATFGSLTGFADDTVIEFEPDLLLDGSAVPFTKDPATVPSRFRFKVNNLGATPCSFEAKVTETDGAYVRETILGNDNVVIMAADRELSFRVVTEFPGVEPPKARLERMSDNALTELVFTGLAAADLSGNAAGYPLYDSGDYVLHVDAYAPGIGTSLSARDYYIRVFAQTAAELSYPNALEGWGYFPREEGLPAAGPEATFLAPDGIGNVAAWDDQSTTAPVTAGSGAPLVINKSSANTLVRHYRRKYSYSLKNDSSTGLYNAPCYIEAALSITGNAGALSNAYTATGDPLAYTVAPTMTSTGTGLRLRNGPYLAELMLLNLTDQGGGAFSVQPGLRVHHKDPNANAFILMSAVQCETPIVIRLEKDAAADPAVKVTVGANTLTVKEKYLPLVFDADEPIACEAGFGVFEHVSQSVTAAFEFVRYAFYDSKYLTGAANIRFPSLHRTADSGKFFRSPCIKLGAAGLAETDPVLEHGVSTPVKAVLTCSATGNLVAKNIPAKVRFCLADFNDANDRSITGFGISDVLGTPTTSQFPAYDSGDILPLASPLSTAAVNLNAAAASTDYTAETGVLNWTVSIDFVSLVRRLFILAYIDSPFLPAPKLFGSAPATDYFDITEAAGVRAGDARGVIRQFLPDFYFRDQPSDTDPATAGLTGGCLSPDVVLAVFNGPDSPATLADHAHPNPQDSGENLYGTVTEASYPLGFARSFANDVYLNMGFADMLAYSLETDNQSNLRVTDTGWTDYTGAPYDKCYYNRLWVRLSNRGIVPGPANVQVFFLDSTLFGAFGVDTARPNPTGTAPNRAFSYHWMWADIRDTNNTADIAGTKVVQTSFLRFKKRNPPDETTADETTAKYDIDFVGAVPALSGWATPSGMVKKFAIAEFVWHTQSGEITGDIHGCRAICVNLANDVPETSEVSTSGIDTSPVPSTSVWTSTQQSNNIAVRNSNLIAGAVPPPSGDVNLKSAVHSDGAPANHRKLPNKFAMGFRRIRVPRFKSRLTLEDIEAVFGLEVDARKLPDTELILRVHKDISSKALPRVLEEFKINVVDKHLDGADFHGSAFDDSSKIPYRYYALKGGRVGKLDGLFVDQKVDWLKHIERGEKIGKLDLEKLADIGLYFRPDTRIKPGAYEVTISQTINGKRIGGYRTTVLMPKPDQLRYVADERTKAVYDVKKFPEALDAIPYGSSAAFTGPGFAFQEGFRFGPVDSFDYFSGKLGNEIVNFSRKCRRPQAPRTLPLLPDKLEGAVVGKVVDQKGKGVEGIKVTLREPKGAGVLGTGVTDHDGRYLVKVASKSGNPVLVESIKRKRTVELIAELPDKRGETRPLVITNFDLCFAAKPIVLKL